MTAPSWLWPLSSTRFYVPLTISSGGKNKWETQRNFQPAWVIFCQKQSRNRAAYPGQRGPHGGQASCGTMTPLVNMCGDALLKCQNESGCGLHSSALKVVLGSRTAVRMTSVQGGRICFLVQPKELFADGIHQPMCQWAACLKTYGGIFWILCV
jgi:hypothetical protein